MVRPIPAIRAGTSFFKNNLLRGSYTTHLNSFRMISTYLANHTLVSEKKTNDINAFKSDINGRTFHPDARRRDLQTQRNAA